MVFRAPSFFKEHLSYFLCISSKRSGFFLFDDWAKVNVELTEKKFQSSRRGVVTLTQLPDQMKT
jgi:hypothetical protein